MEAHFPRKALATHEASSPQVVLLAVLNYHRLSQKCIGSGKFNRLSITLSARDYCRTCFDKSMVCVLTTKRLCSDFTSVVNPRRACAARVTVLGLCVCVSVCVCVCVCVCVSVTQHLTFYAFIRATNDTNLLCGG